MLAAGAISGSSVAGGLIGGAVVSAIIANDIGKIDSGPLVKDARFQATIRQLGDQAEPVNVSANKNGL